MTRTRALTASLILLACLFPASTANAQDQQNPIIVSSGLADEQVEVKINYSGAEVILFVSAPPSDEPGGMAVALIGPRFPHTITQQTPSGPRTFNFVSAPTVFAIGAEPEVAETTEPQALIDAGLNAAAAALPSEDQIDAPDLPIWRAAFVELKMEQNLYSLDETIIERLDGGAAPAWSSHPTPHPATISSALSSSRMESPSAIPSKSSTSSAAAWKRHSSISPHNMASSTDFWLS